MSFSIERQGQQWPHRIAKQQQQPPVQMELPFDEKHEPPPGYPRDWYEPLDWGDDLHPQRRNAVRVRLAMPMPTNLQLSGDQPEYRGSHGMNVYEDPQGQWSFKQPKPNLAFTVPLEAAAATLQRNMGLEAPESYAITHNGQPAVVSKWYPNSTQAFQKPPRLADLSPDDQMTIQKNHVLDWLIGNHDSHVGNWMRTEDGKLVSIDKGQAGKYFGHDRLDPTFHPNYYAREPIYNQLYRDHAAGLGQMHDPRTGELGQFVQQVQSIPDEHLKEMFRPYAQSAAKSGLLLSPDNDPSRQLGPRTVPANDPEAFLSALVDRKNNLHKDLGDYHDRMSGVGQQRIGRGRGPHRQGPSPRFRPLNRPYYEQRVPIGLHQGDGWEPLEEMDSHGRIIAHYKAPEGLHSINDVARALNVHPPQVHRWLKHERFNAPEPTHEINNLRYWDSLEPWHEWRSTNTFKPGRPRKDAPPTAPARPGTAPARPRRKPTELQDPDYSQLQNHPRPNPRTPMDVNNRYYNDLSTEDELLRSLHRQPGPGEGGDFLPRSAKTADVGQARGERLYLPGDVADHLGVPRQTLMSWIYNNETPTPTHTSKPHKEMWDNLDVWNKWYNRRKSLKPGPRGYPDGWADEFKNRKDPHHMYTIPEIAQQTGMTMSDVYKSVYRPKSTSVKLPRNTHFAIGDDKRGVHFWESLKPLQSRAAAIRQANNSSALTDYMMWCAHYRKKADRNTLAEYAAISGMDTETYLDLYLFMANDDGIFRSAQTREAEYWDGNPYYCNCGSVWKVPKLQHRSPTSPGLHFRLPKTHDKSLKFLEQHMGRGGWSTPEKPRTCSCGEEWDLDHYLDPERNRRKTHLPVDPATGKIRRRPTNNIERLTFPPGVR